MPETKTKPSVVQPRKTETKAEQINDSTVHEVLFPETTADFFEIGERKFRIQFMPYKFEQLFRRYAMPILEAEFKPIEKAVFSYTTNQSLITNDLKVTESLFRSELDADAYLPNAMVVICMSQDPRILEAAANGQETPADEWIKIDREYRLLIDYNKKWPAKSPRHYMRDVVRKQSDKLDLMQTLGESLMARCGEAAKLMGVAGEYDSLRLAFTQQVSKFMEKAGKLAGVPGNSFLPSTDNGSETNQRAEPSRSSEIAPPTAEDPEAAPVEDQAAQRVQ